VTVTTAAQGQGAAWRHRARLPLDACDASVPAARSWSRRLIAGWGLAGPAGLPGTAGLIVSELVTNAVRATRAAGIPDGLVAVWLLAGGPVLVAVWDPVPLAAAGRPLPPAVPDSEGGRGLCIVSALAALDYLPARRGKVARAVIPGPAAGR
jgi:histidine kinase-like protein